MTTYGKMSTFLLSMLVGDPTNPYAIQPLAGIPMWWALFVSDPFVATDPLSVELLGSSYVRVPATWDAYNVTGLVNNAEVLFPDINPGATITSIGLMDDETNGNFLAGDNFDAPWSYPAGGTYLLPAGDFFLGFDLQGL